MNLNWFKISQTQENFEFYEDPEYKKEDPKKVSYFKDIEGYIWEISESPPES